MPERKLTDEACKNIIRRIALMHNIEPRLITTRLMSEEDKDDMRYGELPINALNLHVEVWIKAGMPDYAHGKTIPMAEENSSVQIQAQRDEPITSLEGKTHEDSQ